MLVNDFFNQRYITFNHVNAIIPGQDRVYPNTHFLLGIDLFSIDTLSKASDKEIPKIIYT